MAASYYVACRSKATPTSISPSAPPCRSRTGKVNARLNVSNLFDDHSLTNVTGTTAAGDGLCYTNPGRSVFLSLSASL